VPRKSRLTNFISRREIPREPARFRHDCSLEIPLTLPSTSSSVCVVTFPDFPIFVEVPPLRRNRRLPAIDAQRDGNSISIELAAMARARVERGIKSKDKFYKNRIGDARHRAVVKIHRWIFYPSMYLHGRARTRAHRRTYRRVRLYEHNMYTQTRRGPHQYARAPHPLC